MLAQTEAAVKAINFSNAIYKCWRTLVTLLAIVQSGQQACRLANWQMQSATQRLSYSCRLQWFHCSSTVAILRTCQATVSWTSQWRTVPTAESPSGLTSCCSCRNKSTNKLACQQSGLLNNGLAKSDSLLWAIVSSTIAIACTFASTFDHRTWTSLLEPRRGRPICTCNAHWLQMHTLVTTYCSLAL